MTEYVPFQILSAADLNASIDGLAAALASLGTALVAEAVSRNAAITTAVGAETLGRIAADLALISAPLRPVTAAASLAAALKALSVPTPGAPFGVPAFEVHAVGNENGIIGSVVNDFPPATALFPTGVTGYGIVAGGAAGNTAWGVFGRGDLYDQGVALGGEFDSFNYSGHRASTTTPPDLGVGTSGYYPIAMLLAAYGTSSSAIGLYIAYGLEQQFETGIYMHPSSYATTGLFIDAQNSGSAAIPALIRGSGVSPILTLQPMNTPGGAPGNAVFEVQDSTGAVKAYINQSGDFATPGISIGHDGTINYLTAATSATAVGGSSTLPANPLGFLVQKLNGLSIAVPYYSYSV